MSPVSRRRKAKKTRTTKPSKPARFDVAEPVCTCPACTDGPTGVAAVVDGFFALTRDLALAADPLDAEMVGATILGVPELDRDAVEIGMVEMFIPLIAERESPAALALLLALGSVAESDVARAAHAAADRLVATGIQSPRWAADLQEPVTSSNHRRLVLEDLSTDLLVCEFQRGDRTLPVMVRVDTSAGGVATDISSLAEPLEMVIAILTREIRADGGGVVTEELDAAEFRRQVEDALDARLDLDVENEIIDDTFDEDGGPGYGPMELFLRKRLEALPESDRATEAEIELDLPSLAEVKKLIAGGGAGTRPEQGATGTEAKRHA